MRRNRITQELITANCAEKTTEIFSQSTCISKSSDSISWGLIIACRRKVNKNLIFVLALQSRSYQTQRRPWSRCWERAREGNWQKGVCTTMTTKWQLIETWIINATPHSKMLPQGQLQPPIVRLPIPPPLPSTVAHCPFAFVGSVERWPGKLPRMLTNWLSDWRTVSSYKTSLILPNSISDSPPSPLADRQATS